MRVVSGQFRESEYRAQAEFRSALRAFLHVAERHARQAGIPPQQYLVLLAIRGHPAYPHVSVGQLADSLRIHQSSTSLVVDRMVRSCLLTRLEDTGDRRRICLTLTSRGQKVLDTILAANRRELGDTELRLQGMLGGPRSDIA